MDEEHLRILVVDDSSSALHALTRILAPLKAELVTARDGIEGKEAAQQRGFDLIVTDVFMPRMDGLALCRWLKGNPSTSRIPVIILSSLESDDDIERGFDVGADAYVPKSQAAGDLLASVGRVLDRSVSTKDRVLLVVDDSKSIRNHVGHDLGEEGFQVITAPNGKEALRMIESVKPDLVLTDLMMPHMGGRELCRAIKRNEQWKDIPVVVMSSMSDTSNMKRMLQEGAAAFMVKPFNVNNLIQVIDRILSEQFRVMMVERDRLQAERELTLASITSLIRALEARDKYTMGHSESVTRIAMAIAERLGFTQEELTRLHIAGNLHDLGKIGVRDNVLLKPGRLTEEEYEHIKTHTTVVAEILDPLPGLEDILVAASSHHERWDGSGYPKGLVGEDIPLLGRILAVADVYDAMTADRVYRKGMDREKVRGIIVEGRDKQFDPQCVDAFLDWYKETGGVFESPGP